MISLKDDNWLLRLTTSSASAVHVHVSYSDTLTSTISGLNVTQIIHGSQSTVISSATTTTICDSPAEDTSRLIHHISIRSISGSVTVSPHLFNGSTSFQLPICSLDSAAAWVYVGMEGWKKTLSNGDLVVTTGTGGGGSSGNTLLNGTTDPSNDLGENGDFYINTTTKEIFGPKESGVWGSGTSISVGLGFNLYDGTDVTINNTASETQVSSSTIPANSLNANGDSFSFMSFAQLTNSTGANTTFTLRLKVGATTVYQDVTGNIATNAAARAITLEGRVIRTSSTTAEIQMTLTIGSVGTATTGLSDMGVSSTFVVPIKSVLNVAWNWAVNTDLVSTIQLSTANALYTYAHRYHLATAGGPKGADGTGGGGGGWTDVTVTDADFTAANDTRYYIPPALLTANRTVNMGSITTKVMFVNAEPDYFLNFSTASVYALAGTEEIGSLMSLATTHIEKIDTKLIVIN